MMHFQQCFLVCLQRTGDFSLVTSSSNYFLPLHFNFFYTDSGCFDSFSEIARKNIHVTEIFFRKPKPRHLLKNDFLVVTLKIKLKTRFGPRHFSYSYFSLSLAESHHLTAQILLAATFSFLIIMFLLI